MGLLDAPAQPSTGGNAAVLMTRLAIGMENASLLVLGDSTGVIGTAPWPLLVAQWLAAKFPAYTVNYRVWDDTSQAYKALGSASTYPATNAPQTSSSIVQTGTGTGNAGGPFVLDVYNASMPGSNTDYPITNITRWNTIANATAPNLVIINYGHNANTQTTAYRSTHYFLCRTVQEAFPEAGIVQIAQNPRPSSNGEYANDLIRARCVMTLAATEGHGLVNITQRFFTDPNYGTTLTLADGLGVHPNPAGSVTWAQEVQAHLALGMRTVPRGPIGRATRIWLPASSFVLYSGSPTLATVNAEAGMWAMPQAADSHVVASADVPSWWGGTFDLFIAWTVAANTGWTGANNISRWSTYTQAQGLGLTEVNLTSAVVAPAGWGHHQATNTSLGAQNLPTTFQTYFAQMASTVTVASNPVAVRVARNGTDVLDTVAAPVYFMGALLLRRK